MHWHRGLVALSADPITLGHLDLIDQALNCCDEVVVLITVNLEKEERYLFSLEERGDMVTHAIQARFEGMQRLTIICGRHRVTETYVAQACDILIRGLRSEQERTNEEETLRGFTDELPELQTFLLPARPDVSHISSTRAKRAAEHGVDQALRYVPHNVAERLVQRIDIKKGVTATMAMKDYRRTERISEGHFSWGFRAVHREFGFPAFIKQARNIDEPTRTVFKREAKILGSLSIPGIPAFREYCEVTASGQTDIPCIIMELAPGITCRELVKDGKPYDTKKTLWLIYRALSILNKLHTRYNTAHCDVGPDNILIDESDGYGSVNIVDFGLATVMDGSRAALYWNKDFCPPEFLTSKPVTRAADYFSLGKTAHFLLSGGAMDPLATTIPRPVATLINEMMDPRPEARPCDYAELRKRIEKIQNRI